MDTDKLLFHCLNYFYDNLVKLKEENVLKKEDMESNNKQMVFLGYQRAINDVFIVLDNWYEERKKL